MPSALLRRMFISGMGFLLECGCRQRHPFRVETTFSTVSVGSDTRPWRTGAQGFAKVRTPLHNNGFQDRQRNGSVMTATCVSRHGTMPFPDHPPRSRSEHDPGSYPPAPSAGPTFSSLIGMDVRLPKCHRASVRITRSIARRAIPAALGAASAENCASIKKKADLAVNVSGRLPANWLSAPMKIGAFDQPEGFDAAMDDDCTDSTIDDEMADDEMA